MAVETLDHSAATRRRGAPAPQSSGLTVTAFLGRTERGPVDEAVEITSFDEYRRVFGAHCAIGFVSYAVQHYFQHGGEAAVVVRLANRAERAAIDVPAGDGALRLAARRPGSGEHLRVSVDYDRVEHDALRFNLVVQRVARPGSQLIEDQELYPAVSLDPGDRRFVVDALRDSELVRLNGPLPSRRPAASMGARPGDPIRYLDVTRPGGDGEELTDYDIVGSNEEGTGLFALDRLGRIDLVCIPALPTRDFGTTALLAAERYCRRRHALLMWDPPSVWQTSDVAVLGVRALGLTSSNAMIYFPRLRPRGQPSRFPAGLPACGALAGLLAREDAERGVPGRSAGSLKASLTTLIDLGERDAALLRRFGINPLVRADGGAVALAGNVCLARPDNAPTASQRLDASRKRLHVLGVLERGVVSASRVPDAPSAGERLAAQTRALLAQLHDRGALVGSCAEEAYFVRTVSDAPGCVVLRLGVAILRPGQFQTYELEHRAGRRFARELPPLDFEQAVGS
jgi:uncharacterized protein